MESIYRFPSKFEPHLLRKLVHIFAGLGIASIYLLSNLDSHKFSIIVLGASALFTLVEILRLKFDGINQVFINSCRGVLRDTEINSFTGTPFFLLGIGLSFFLFDEQIALLATIILSLADPASSFIGIRYGKRKVMQDRTFEGSYACFLTTFLIVAIYGLMYFPLSLKIIIFAFFTAIATAFIELLSTRVDDNFTLSFFSACAMALINILVALV
ncbi:diacylglycerol/polyprenol kinase family protein [Halobacteriovorax sp. ZH4_bin.1]|uniref:diacylglycerol/polyprenol kinase family protein n=1 Tax=unclassified Halobacteriovorax TaxID=2639665 RepID=UPI00371DA473